ncbi:MAG: hypothetical protein KJ804_15260 [Proteobacteria bacterium]|nr:hypothetical protein [Pseudomonadota bacterium]MBU1059669.1 hypothetical protein [Pseudomonadota bacterium]
MKSSLLLLALLLLHGCAPLTHLDSKVDNVLLVDQYLAEQEYGKALTLISSISKEDPQALELEKKRKTILDQVQTFEQQSIALALNQERLSNWPEAKRIYVEALKKLNTSRTLEEAREGMLTRFQNRMDALQYEELIVTGEWLRKKLPLLRSLQASNPGDLIIQWRYSRTENEARETAKELLRIGEQMLAENNAAMAQRILPLAAELDPQLDMEAAISSLDSMLQSRKDKKLEDRRRIAQKKDEKVIEEFNRAMAHNNLSEARSHLTRLSPATRTSVAAELMQERLDKAMAEYIQEELSIGNSFYRARGYKQAIKAWKNILAIDPDNEAVQTKLERAEKVVEKLNALEEQQKKQ